MSELGKTFPRKSDHKNEKRKQKKSKNAASEKEKFGSDKEN